MKGSRNMNLKIIMRKNKAEREVGITLIALVVTIIILLILARSEYQYINRTKWNIN